MRRTIRAVVGAAMSLLMVAATASPGAAAYPGPRNEEWWFAAWQIPKIWQITHGEGVIVAILDTGVQASLPELSGAVLPGIDAVSGSGDGRTDTDDATSFAGHGTAMATTVASHGGPSGFVGVAPAAKILPVTVHADLSSLNKAIHFSVDHGAKVISISQTAVGSCPDDVQDAVSYAIEHNVITVVSAGDQGQEGNPPQFPANCIGVLSVGAIDNHLQAWSKTESQPYVNIAAPGVGGGAVLIDGQFHRAEGGTSQAAALTAGAVALVQSKYPHESARMIVQRLFASVRDAGPAGRDPQTGYGAIRPYYALVNKVPENSPNPVFDAYDQWAAAHGKKSGGKQESPAASEHKGHFFDWNIWGGLIGIAVFIIILLGIIALMRRSQARKRGASHGGPGLGQGPGGPRPGPPPSFGPPPNQGPPPPGGAQPSFRPPPNEGPPPERR